MDRACSWKCTSEAKGRSLPVNRFGVVVPGSIAVSRNIVCAARRVLSHQIVVVRILQVDGGKSGGLWIHISGVQVEKVMISWLFWTARALQTLVAS